MATRYEYTYEYEITDPDKYNRTSDGNAGYYTQRTVGQPSYSRVPAPHTSRSDMADPLVNLQHDRIWNKLYDPISMDKQIHDIEIQKMARRQDRKIIKLEAAYGSDRQTFIVKRDYDLHVRDVTDEAAKAFKIPADQLILFWKGRDICDRPDELLETLGIENNNTMRLCRADDELQHKRQQQLRSQQTSPINGLYGQQQGLFSGGLYGQQQGSSSSGLYGQQGSSSGGLYGQQGSSSGGLYAQQGSSSGGLYTQQGSSAGGFQGQQQLSSSSNELYGQQGYYPQYQQQAYNTYPAGFEQQQYVTSANSSHICNCSCHQDQRHNCKCCCHGQGPTNHYHQLTNQTISPPVAATYIINLQIGFGDRVEGLAIGRQHPLTLYDLQVELQQHYNIPILEQKISFNGMPLTHLPPDTSLDIIGIINNSFISLWYRNNLYDYQLQSNGYFSPRQQGISSYYEDGYQSLRSGDTSSRRMYVSNSGDEIIQNGGNQEVLKIEVFHGSDRHVLVLRSAYNIRIIDLMEELQNITSVPIQNQKLYYHGQELQLMKERSLRDVGLGNNAQVRLIGQPTKSRYVAMLTGNRAQ